MLPGDVPQSLTALKSMSDVGVTCLTPFTDRILKFIASTADKRASVFGSSIATTSGCGRRGTTANHNSLRGPGVAVVPACGPAALGQDLRAPQNDQDPVYSHHPGPNSRRQGPWGAEGDPSDHFRPRGGPPRACRVPSQEYLPKYIGQDAKQRPSSQFAGRAGSWLQAGSSSKELRGLSVRAQVRV